MKKIVPALVGLAVAVSVAACGNNNAAPSASPDPPIDPTSQAPPPTPTIDPVVDTDPAGKWNLRGITLKSNNSAYAKVGAKSIVTWTFHPSCDQTKTCGGRITSSSGSKFTYDWDGRVVTVHFKSPAVTEGLCTNGDGSKAVGSHFTRVELSPDVRLVKHGKTYVGIKHGSARVSELRNCSNSYTATGSPSPSATQRWVMSAKK